MDQRIAIEVELHAKAPRRLRAILRGYRALTDYSGLAAVTYITDRSDVAALIRREARKTLLGAKLEVGPLEQVVGLTREKAAKARHAPSAGLVPTEGHERRVP